MGGTGWREALSSAHLVLLSFASIYLIDLLFDSAPILGFTFALEGVGFVHRFRAGCGRSGRL